MAYPNGIVPLRSFVGSGDPLRVAAAAAVPTHKSRRTGHPVSANSPHLLGCGLGDWLQPAASKAARWILRLHRHKFAHRYACGVQHRIDVHWAWPSDRVCARTSQRARIGRSSHRRPRSSKPCRIGSVHIRLLLTLLIRCTSSSCHPTSKALIKTARLHAFTCVDITTMSAATCFTP